MTCASCVLNVEKALRRVPGVTGVEVNLASEQARILAAQPLALSDLIAAVEDAGFEAHPLTATQPPPARLAQPFWPGGGAPALGREWA